MHLQWGVQEQQLLSDPLIVRETAEPMFDEQEHVVMLHDFTFRDPQEILQELQVGSGGHAMHNIPGIPVGKFAVRPGPMMAAYDIFEVVLKGIGGHGAMPHHTIDPVVVGAHIVTALQSIVARNVEPMDTAVVSTTQIHAGDAWNVIPQECTLRGTVRTFKKSVQDMIEKNIEKISRNVAAGFGAEVVEWRYERR